MLPSGISMEGRLQQMHGFHGLALRISKYKSIRTSFRTKTDIITIRSAYQLTKSMFVLQCKCFAALDYIPQTIFILWQPFSSLTTHIQLSPHIQHWSGTCKLGGDFVTNRLSNHLGKSANFSLSVHLFFHQLTLSHPSPRKSCTCL